MSGPTDPSDQRSSPSTPTKGERELIRRLAAEWLRENVEAK